MFRRLWGHLRPRCLTDTTPVAEHPALLMMQDTENRLDRMLAMVPHLRYDLEPRESGNTLRDLTAGTYGEANNE